MVQKTIVTLSDDLDGSDATATVRYSVAGSNYEIDLNEAHQDEFREALAPWIAASRKVGGSTSARGRRGRSTSSAGPSPEEVRTWLRERGHIIGDRGRIPGTLRAEFDAAH